MSVSGELLRVGTKACFAIGGCYRFDSSFLMGFLGNSFFYLWFSWVKPRGPKALSTQHNALISSSVILEDRESQWQQSNPLFRLRQPSQVLLFQLLGIVFWMEGNIFGVALLAFPAWFVIPNALQKTKGISHPAEMWRVSHLQLLALAGHSLLPRSLLFRGFLPLQQKMLGIAWICWINSWARRSVNDHLSLDVGLLSRPLPI
ncbi:MAG: hypothetical protein Ct9H90mP11_04110 [Acidimicrobiales bacterium]|nr:MAG: hypothetical protein Ct9H90mP11_04110 [Acidimicrobiales bacterium]